MIREKKGNSPRYIYDSRSIRVKDESLDLDKDNTFMGIF
jgi:hypothetical protein